MEYYYLCFSVLSVKDSGVSPSDIVVVVSVTSVDPLIITALSLSPCSWLEGKRLDDRAENLWRVHDGLYDLTPFIDQHPGGRDWLTWTKVEA